MKAAMEVIERREVLGGERLRVSARAPDREQRIRELEREVKELRDKLKKLEEMLEKKDR